MMKLRQIDGHQPIVPDKSLGGVLLRANIGDYAYDIALITAESRGEAEQVLCVVDAWYFLRPFHIKIGVSVTNGTIFQISALEGYEGTLLGRVRVGMTAQEALALMPDLYYDATDDGLLSTVYKGLALGLPERDPPEERVPSLRISSISIFAPELHGWGGDSGKW